MMVCQAKCRRAGFGCVCPCRKDVLKREILFEGSRNGGHEEGVLSLASCPQKYRSPSLGRCHGQGMRRWAEGYPELAEKSGFVRQHWSKAMRHVPVWHRSVVHSKYQDIKNQSWLYFLSKAEFEITRSKMPCL